MHCCQRHGRQYFVRGKQLIAITWNFRLIRYQVIPLSDIEDEAQKQILLYMVRFRETVFVHNVGTDERFCNHPRVKSVIALPIIRAGDLLGVLYLVI